MNVVSTTLKALFVSLVTAIFRYPGRTITFVVSCIGGLAATETFVGDIVGGVVGWCWWWVSYALSAITFAMVVGDIADGKAQRFATYLPLVIPSLFLSTPEKDKAHKILSGWITDVQQWYNGELAGFMGSGVKNGMLIATTVIAIALAVTVNERYLLKRGATTTGVTTATTGPRASVRAGAKTTAR